MSNLPRAKAALVARLTLILAFSHQGRRDLLTAIRAWLGLLQISRRAFFNAVKAAATASMRLFFSPPIRPSRDFPFPSNKTNGQRLITTIMHATEPTGGGEWR